MSRTVKISWANTSTNLISQRIFSGTDANKLSLLKEIDGTATSFVDDTVDQSAATTVYYQIVSVGTEGGKETTAVSATVSVELAAVTKVNAPTNVAATEVDS